jgi:hypothetical protein
MTASPPYRPPLGEGRELGLYKEKYPAMPFQLNTFGFGYSVDSQMLLQV